MFPGDSGTKLESVFLRGGRIFRYKKKRKTLFGRGSCCTDREEDGYELASYMDEDSCEEEEDYGPMSEGEKYLEESIEAL